MRRLALRMVTSWPLREAIPLNRFQDPHPRSGLARPFIANGDVIVRSRDASITNVAVHRDSSHHSLRGEMEFRALRARRNPVNSLIEKGQRAGELPPYSVPWLRPLACLAAPAPTMPLSPEAKQATHSHPYFAISVESLLFVATRQPEKIDEQGS